MSRVMQMIRAYLVECLRWDNSLANTKYTVMEMMSKRRHPDHLKVTHSLTRQSHQSYSLSVSCEAVTECACMLSMARAGQAADPAAGGQDDQAGGRVQDHGGPHEGLGHDARLGQAPTGAGTAQVSTRLIMSSQDALNCVSRAGLMSLPCSRGSRIWVCMCCAGRRSRNR